MITPVKLVSQLIESDYADEEAAEAHFDVKQLAKEVERGEHYLELDGWKKYDELVVSPTYFKRWVGNPTHRLLSSVDVAASPFRFYTKFNCVQFFSVVCGTHSLYWFLAELNRLMQTAVETDWRTGNTQALELAARQIKLLAQQCEP